MALSPKEKQAAYRDRQKRKGWKQEAELVRMERMREYIVALEKKVRELMARNPLANASEPLPQRPKDVDSEEAARVAANAKANPKEFRKGYLTRVLGAQHVGLLGVHESLKVDAEMVDLARGARDVWNELACELEGRFKSAKSADARQSERKKKTRTRGATE